MEPNAVEVENEIGSPGLEPGRNGRADRWAQPQFRRTILGAALLIVIITLALVVHYHSRVSTDDAQVDGHITPMASKVYGNVL
jgi:multidrug resistance efflux pump